MQIESNDLPSIFGPIISTISKGLKMNTWRSDVFFPVGEAATLKWTHGEVAVFGSTVYKIFALKCQKLRTPLASLAPCVMKKKISFYSKMTRINNAEGFHTLCFILPCA